MAARAVISGFRDLREPATVSAILVSASSDAEPPQRLHRSGNSSKSCSSTRLQQTNKKFLGAEYVFSPSVGIFMHAALRAAAATAMAAADAAPNEYGGTGARHRVQKTASRSCGSGCISNDCSKKSCSTHECSSSDCSIKTAA